MDESSSVGPPVAAASRGMRVVADACSSVLVWVGGRGRWTKVLLWILAWPVLGPAFWVTRQPESRVAHGSLAVGVIFMLLAGIVSAEGPNSTSDVVPTISAIATETEAPQPALTPSAIPSAIPSASELASQAATPVETTPPPDATAPDPSQPAGDTASVAPAPTETGATPSGSTPVSASPRRDDAPIIASGQVVDIVDGDTIDLDDGTRIRLAIVDTPEVYGGYETCGPEASDFTGRWAAGQRVVVYRPTGAPANDRFGRTVGEVVRLTDGSSLNVALAAAGLATVDERFTSEDRDLAARARTAQDAAADPGCVVQGDEPSGDQPPGDQPPADQPPGDQPPAASTDGDGGVTITTIRFDGPGNDVEVYNDSEYVELVNSSGADRDLSGWRLVDTAGNSITIPNGFTIAAGGSFRVYSGQGDADPDGRYFAGRGQAMWNNSGGDTASLQTSTGQEVDTYSY
jgi:endonuclease YncB( thermonuclease family)